MIWSNDQSVRYFILCDIFFLVLLSNLYSSDCFTWFDSMCEWQTLFWFEFKWVEAYQKPNVFFSTKNDSRKSDMWETRKNKTINEQVKERNPLSLFLLFFVFLSPRNKNSLEFTISLCFFLSFNSFIRILWLS